MGKRREKKRRGNKEPQKHFSERTSWFLYASEINGTVYCKWFCLGCGGGCRFPNRQQHLIEGSFIVGYCRCMTTPPFRWQFYYFTLVEQTGGAITRGPQQPTVTRKERFLPSPISGRRWIIIVGSSLCQEREALKLNGSSLDEMSEWWCCRLLGNILCLGRRRRRVKFHAPCVRWWLKETKMEFMTENQFSALVIWTNELNYLPWKQNKPHLCPYPTSNWYQSRREITDRGLWWMDDRWKERLWGVIEDVCWLCGYDRNRQEW